MINSKNLRRAVGISQEKISGNSNPTVPLINNQCVVVGRFKRGRTDKPFKVNADNYKALLGEDQTNPSYLIVQDAFIAGAESVFVLRIGDPLTILSDGSQVQPSDTSYEAIALESYLYPIPIAKDDVYNAKTIALNITKRSNIISPNLDQEGYKVSIDHLSVTSSDSKKSHSIDDSYTPNFEALNIQISLGTKNTPIINDGYKPIVEAVSISLSSSTKSIKSNDAYLAKYQHLDALRISKYKSKTLGEGYTTNIAALNAVSGGKVKSIGAIAGTGGYASKATLLDLSISKILVTAAVNNDGYMSSAKPLNATSKRIYSSVLASDYDAYSTGINMPDIAIKTIVVNSSIADGYVPSIKALDAVLVSKLAGNETFEQYDAYKQTGIELKDIQSRKYTSSRKLAVDGYKPTLTALNVSTTQRIK